MGFFSKAKKSFSKVKKAVRKVKNVVKPIHKQLPRASTALLTGGTSEIARAAGYKGFNKALDPIFKTVWDPDPLGIGKALLASNKVGDSPKVDTDAIAAAGQKALEDEEKKRKLRRNNILTRPLGALTSNAVLTRVLTGQ